jgi:hypothetical protein
VKTENLYEDLHWIVLIAGYILSDEVSGEKSLIPDEIMMYSIAESENVHLESTVKYLTSLGTADIGRAVNSVVLGFCRWKFSSVNFIRLLNLTKSNCENDLDRAVRAISCID